MQTLSQKDRKYLKLAFEEAKGSDDPKAKINALSGVGAIIVKHDTIIGRSANIVPTAIQDHYSLNDPNSNLRYHLIEHAERSALYDVWNSSNSPVGATIYCTRFPCSDCARAIIQSGLSRLVVPAGINEDLRWRESQSIAKKMLRNANIVIRHLRIG